MEQQDFLDMARSVAHRNYHIKLWPFPCDLLLLSSVLTFLPLILRLLLLQMPENTIKSQFLALNLPYMAFLIVGLICLSLFIVLTLYAWLRRPAGNHRIREELRRWFWEKCLFCKTKAEMRRYLFIYPKIETNKDIKVKTVHFKVNSSKFTEQTIEQLKQSIANFRNCQSIEVEPYITKSGRQNGFKLILGYESASNVFNQELSQMGAWNE